MSILRKSVGELTVDDMREVVTAGARESGELEFKGDLPFKRQKGQPEKSDRWIEKGDHVGDYARNELLAELIAFANAAGGTLLLGVVETNDVPRRAESLAPLPNCEALAKRLLDAAEDVVQPRLPALVSRGIPVDATGSGFVVMRIGKSQLGPHRLEPTREFYVRRGERTERMTVREITDLTLDLARSGDRIEQEFSKRREIAHQHFTQMPSSAGEHPLVFVRVSALPMTPQAIPDITSRRDVWWRGNAFIVQIDRKSVPLGYPARLARRRNLSEVTAQEGSIRKTFCTSSPKWLITFTQISPRSGLGNGIGLPSVSVLRGELVVPTFGLTTVLAGRFESTNYDNNGW